MKWILIWALHGTYQYSAGAGGQVVFEDKKACMAAGELIRKDTEARSGGSRALLLICVPDRS